ncbi:maleylpyruvate isomerase family mycothiol-dependent enzyme [Nocardia flavorosea]|uniref:Maleylpyruvate isomerase family mycothiol-dependent enzyme n=1 Tax=Nocardia flavorosea TaxID=53429 RepID=A0A846YK11_9NOCA|nr:maleylpyruvate isomerase family mycothiol-dependent enzyme [Nocardia flavorosea]NKY57239.1 maleylpyruvate isomerase family mycothiol-dependent enzyme [Nocardia flavorosea]
MNVTATTEELAWTAVAAERTSPAGLLHELTAEQWDHPSLREGWRVRDVVAHILLTSQAKLPWLLWQTARARGSITRMNFGTAIRYADRNSPENLLTELRAITGLRHRPIATNAVDRLMDLLVHGHDIAAPLGIHRDMPIDAARWSIDRVWEMGWPFHARRTLAAHHLTATDTDWSAGSGTTLRAPIADMLLLVTGRKSVTNLRPGCSTRLQ